MTNEKLKNQFDMLQNNFLIFLDTTIMDDDPAIIERGKKGKKHQPKRSQPSAADLPVAKKSKPVLLPVTDDEDDDAESVAASTGTNI